jgi:hypothetical protein
MTWALWRKLDKSEFKNTLSLNPHGGFVTSSEFRTRGGWEQKNVKAERAFTFPRIETTTWPYVRGVAVVEEDYDMGVFLDVPYLKGHIYILNMPENSYDLLCLPVEILSRIRQSFNSELGFTLEAPGKVALYPYGDKQYVLYNLGEKEVPVTLKFDGTIEKSGWKEIVNNLPVTVNEIKPEVDRHFRGPVPVTSEVSLKLKPFEIAIIQAP